MHGPPPVKSQKGDATHWNQYALTHGVHIEPKKAMLSKREHRFLHFQNRRTQAVANSSRILFRAEPARTQAICAWL